MCVFNFLKDTSREKDWRCLSISKKKQFSERKGKGAIPFCGIISSISREWNCTYLVFSSCQSLLYSWHELCTLGKCPAGKCPFGKVSFGESFVGEIFVRGIARLGKCPLGNYQSGKCLWETVHRGKVRRSNVRRRTVLEHYFVTSVLLKIFYFCQITSKI